MKRKAITGIALLLLVTIFTGCGGVSQEDYDAAVAERDAVQNQISPLQNQLDTLQSNLDSAQVELAALEVLIADLEAAAAEKAAGYIYTNTDYGFSLRYPGDWSEKTEGLGPGVVSRIGEGAYYIPAVRVIIRDEGEGATLEEAFTAHLTEDGGKTIDSFVASDITINDTEFTRAEITYTGGYGTYDSLIIGLVKEGKWIIIEVYTLSSYPFSDEDIKTDIINSVTFE
jgi:hypothetical protein